MTDEFEFTLNSSLTKEDWDKLTDVELENTMSITFQTPQGRQVKYIKHKVLKSIRLDIAQEIIPKSSDEYGYEAKWLNMGLRIALKVIDKYITESEDKEK